MSQEQTTKRRKEKAPSKKKNMIMAIVAVVVMIGVGASYYFYWEANAYLKTENAKVTTELYSVVPTTPGRLVKFTVQQGSRVSANEVIGRVENGSYLRSPIDGQVMKTEATLNEMVGPTSLVAVIADTDNIYVGANIEETQITKVKEGQPVSVMLDAFPGKTFKGRVSRIDPLTQTALSGNQLSFTTSGTYTKVTQLIPIRITIDDDVDLTNLIGTNATIKIKVR